MTKIENNFIEYLETEYDINTQFEFIEEREVKQIEIESPKVNVDLKIIATCKPDYETGGEPDEFIFSSRDKNLFIEEIEMIGDEGELRVTDKFKNKIEEVLNNSLYDD